MEHASATLDVVADLFLSTKDDDSGGSGLETAAGRRYTVDDDDDAARGSTPPNDVDLTRLSYQNPHSAAVFKRYLLVFLPLCIKAEE